MIEVKLSQVSKDVKVEDGRLFFGEKEVRNCSFVKSKTIAKLYVIRVLRDGFWALVTTLDLHNGEFWMAGTEISRGQTLPSATYRYWSQVEHVLNTLCAETKGRNWAVFEEEDFDTSYLNNDELTAVIEDVVGQG